MPHLLWVRVAYACTQEQVLPPASSFAPDALSCSCEDGWMPENSPIYEAVERCVPVPPSLAFNPSPTPKDSPSPDWSPSPATDNSSSPQQPYK